MSYPPDRVILDGAADEACAELFAQGYIMRIFKGSLYDTEHHTIYECCIVVGEDSPLGKAIPAAVGGVLQLPGMYARPDDAMRDGEQALQFLLSAGRKE